MTNEKTTETPSDTTPIHNCKKKQGNTTQEHGKTAFELQSYAEQGCASSDHAVESAQAPVFNHPRIAGKRQPSIRYAVLVLQYKKKEGSPGVPLQD
mmetsp:Transcript_16143/g.36938  ORF Transcript_16143/g.36938 Transcript_16143/m.36938 type:complete len:96 (-) Transcript_16143:452-739(-)